MPNAYHTRWHMPTTLNVHKIFSKLFCVALYDSICQCALNEYTFKPNVPITNLSIYHHVGENLDMSAYAYAFCLSVTGACRHRTCVLKVVKQQEKGVVVG